MVKIKKKKMTAITAVIALVCAVAIIVSAFLPYFSNTTSAIIVGSTKSEISGFGLISALFANTDSDNYENKGDTAGEKSLYGMFAYGKTDEDNGGNITLMLVCALASLVFGILAVLCSLGAVLAPKGNIKLALQVVFGLAFIFSVGGIILGYSLAAALSTGVNIGSLSLASTTTVIGFGEWLFAIGALLGLGSTFIKL